MLEQKVINEKKLQELIQWHPFPGQQEILDSQARDKVICAGTRFGKSMLCGYIAFKELLQDNKRIWVVSLTYDMTRKIFNYICDFAGRFDRRLLKGVSNRPIPEIRIPEWNSWVQCKSIETPTSLMGEELDLALIDEAARMKSEIWQRYLLARLTSRQGKSFTISTPFGKNWFYRRWVETKEQGGSFHFTSKDNPTFPITEWERAKRELPEDIFKQEYMAAFLDDAAAAIRGVRECIWGELQEYKLNNFYSMGVDLGKHEDFTVISIINRQTFHLDFLDRFKRIDWPFQKQRIYEIAKQYHFPRITIDSTGIGDPISDDLRHMGLAVEDFKYTNKSKEQLIWKLSLYVQQKKISYPSIDYLIDELEGFGYQTTDSGHFKYGAPDGMHDDCVNSLGLAVWDLPENPISAEGNKPLLYNINSFR